MMHNGRACSGGRYLAGFVLMGLMVAGAAAQPGAAKRLDAVRLDGGENSAFNALRDGRTDVKGENKALLEKAARWYVNRLTHVEVQTRSQEGTAAVDTMSDVVTQAMRQIPDLKRLPKASAQSDRQRRFVQEFSKPLVTAIEEVLQHPQWIARINAARILARLGESGLEELTDPLAKAVSDKQQIDGVKLYAAKGLKEVFESVPQFKDPAREAQGVQALVAFIQRPPNWSTGPSAEQEAAAFHYIRRAAIEALAASRVPAIVLDKKVTGRPAFDLLRIVAREEIKPVPTLSEQVEAAIGLMQMQSKRYDNYQPDYAAFHLGYFLVDYVGKYNEDRQKESTIRSEPWKIQSARMQQALQQMLAENKKSPYVIEFCPKADGYLKQVERGEPVQIKNLRDWLQQKPPKATSLFKDDDKTVVKIPSNE